MALELVITWLNRILFLKLLEVHEIRYCFLPAVFLLRFIVQAHRLAEARHLWQEGILLAKGGQRAQVEADYREKKIILRYAPGAEELRDKVIEKLEEIQHEGRLRPERRDRGEDWERENELFWSGSWRPSVEQLVAAGRLEEALKRLYERGDGEVRAEVLVLRHRLATLRKMERLGTISAESAGIEWNQIATAAVELGFGLG